jgi:hypothetical protein
MKRSPHYQHYPSQLRASQCRKNDVTATFAALQFKAKLAQRILREGAPIAPIASISATPALPSLGVEN